MSVTSAMFTGVSGLLNNAEGMNVIGNNLSNVNTIGFKSGRVLFSDMLSTTIGSNSQIGRGTQIQKVDNLFTQGSFETTEAVTDLALQGSSFFALKDPNSIAPMNQNDALLTRAGAFRVDSNLTLVNPDGYQVLDTQGNPIIFSDNAAGIAAATAALTTQMTALQGKTTALDTNAALLVTAAATDLATANADLSTQLAPLSAKATAIDTSATDLVTAADAAVATAQSDLKTTLSPLQAKAAVLDTKALGLQTGANTAVTTAQQALYNTGAAGESLVDLLATIAPASVLETNITALNTAAALPANNATVQEIAAAQAIVNSLTAAQTAVTTANNAAVTPAQLAAAKQAVDNLTTLITNSNTIFTTVVPTNLTTAYASISGANLTPVTTAQTVVDAGTTTLNTALTAQTTANAIKNATAAALVQVNTAYNAAAPTATQAGDAVLALNNVSGTISGSSGVFAGIANAEYTTLNTSLTDPPALAGLTATANTAVTALQSTETQQTAANAIKTSTAAAVTAANTLIATPSTANASNALAALNSAGTAITGAAATFTTPSIAAAYGLLNSSLLNGPTLASLTTTVNSATAAVTAAQVAQTSATTLKTSTASALATANTAATSQNITDISNALTALAASSTLVANSAASFLAGTAATAYGTLNTALGSAPDVTALTASVNTASNNLTTQHSSGFSKIVKVEPNGLITYLGKDGITTYYYNGSGQAGVDAIQANAGTAQRLAVIAPTDPSSLEKTGGTMFKQSAASGVPAAAFSLNTNTANGTSEKIFSNSLEQSNVDMAAQFVKMILTQRAYSANSKTITTADEMTQEVLNLKR